MPLPSRARRAALAVLGTTLVALSGCSQSSAPPTATQVDAIRRRPRQPITWDARGRQRTNQRFSKVHYRGACADKRSCIR